MLKLTLVTDETSSTVLDRVTALSKMLGIAVEAVDLGGYLVAGCVGGESVEFPPSFPTVEVPAPAPVFTPPTPVFTTPEPVEQTNG